MEQNHCWETQVETARKRLENKIRFQCPLDIASLPPSDEQPSNVLGLFHSSGVLSERDIEITESADASALLEKIHSRHYSAEEVVISFAKRAVLAHRLTNCLMDVNFTASIERARELDVHLAKTGTIVGPLHGLPISVKDLTSVKDCAYTMGYVSWAENVSDSDAVVVDSLRKAGAVIFAKTTMPQSGMALETTSQLLGRTLNPRNKHLVAGGSSGGEGALLACRGSILGIGTDSGGSIRIPAAFNGLYSMKPSSSRVSYEGNMNNSGGIGAASSIGPMGRSVRDLRLVMKVLVDDEHWLKDVAVVEKPWVESGIRMGDGVSIGVMEGDGVHHAQPLVLEALYLAKGRIEGAGHCVTPISPTPFNFEEGAKRAHRLSYELGRDFISAELNKTGEPPIPAIAYKLQHQQRPLAEVVENHRNWKAYKDHFLSAWMQTALCTPNGKPIDALLLPVSSAVGFEHDTLPPAKYASIFNFVDYPVVTIPVTCVSDGLGDARYEGMPICLQLVSTTLTEERLLAVAEVVDRAIHGSV